MDLQIHGSEKNYEFNWQTITDVARGSPVMRIRVSIFDIKTSLRGESIEVSIKDLQKITDQAGNALRKTHIEARLHDFYYLSSSENTAINAAGRAV